MTLSACNFHDAGTDCSCPFEANIMEIEIGNVEDLETGTTCCLACCGGCMRRL